MTVRDIAVEVMQRRGMNTTDARTGKLVAKQVNNAATRQAADLVERAGDGKVAAWKVIG